MALIVIRILHSASRLTVMFSTALSEALMATDMESPALERTGSRPQLARIVLAFTVALSIAWFSEKVSYSVLLTRPGVDNIDEPKPNMSGTIGDIPPQSSAVRLTEGSGHVEFDATIAASEALYGSNCMMAGDATCKTEMHARYKNTEIVAEADAAILVCCHNVRIAAPSPFQASDMS